MSEPTRALDPDEDILVAAIAELLDPTPDQLWKTAERQLAVERARIAAAHVALTLIDDGDDDAYNTLESTVEYVVARYQRVADAEEAAADENAWLRAELAAVRDLAYRAGPGAAAADALQAIHIRTVRALAVKDAP